MTMFGDGLDAAVQKTFTRPAPKSAGVQMRYLVKQLKGTRPVAELLGISQRTVERYVKDQIKKPRSQLAARLEREVKNGGSRRSGPRPGSRRQRPAASSSTPRPASATPRRSGQRTRTASGT